MGNKILGVRWIGSGSRHLGAVAFELGEGEWSATIDVVNSMQDEKYITQDIAANGADLLPREAHGFFPVLDITKYKNYASLTTATRG